MFNEYFQSMLSNFDQSSNPLHGETDCEITNPDLESITVTEQEVVHILQHLEPKKSTGSDNLSPTFLKYFSSYVAPSICRIINRSLHEGIFPVDWGRAQYIKAREAKTMYAITDQYRCSPL